MHHADHARLDLIETILVELVWHFDPGLDTNVCLLCSGTQYDERGRYTGHRKGCLVIPMERSLLDGPNTVGRQKNDARSEPR